MVIREYRRGDYKQVLEVWKATGIYDPERGDTESVILRCVELGGKFLVLSDPERARLTGTSWMTYDGRRLHLHHFAIRPEHQGKGLGRLLAAESIRFARKKACPVKLEVHRENRRAIRLYENVGFHIFEDYLILMNRHP